MSATKKKTTMSLSPGGVPGGTPKPSAELERRTLAYLDGSPGDSKPSAVESAPPSSTSAAPKTDRCIQSRKTKEDVRQVNVQLPVSLFRRMKVQAALNDTRQGALIIAAVERMVSELEEQG